MKVALATSENYPNLSPDDSELAGELGVLGIDAAPAIWSDPAIDWNAFDGIVLRSCWDYHLQPDAFARWIDSLRVPVFNPREVVRWNMHKSYLFDLAARGVLIPRTEIVRDVIVKPAISASAHNTHYMRGETIVQEFVEEIVRDGEWSIVFFDRSFSHSAKKIPKQGDFRVQEEHGGTSLPVPAPQHVIDGAANILSKVDGDVLYARVDVVDRPQGVTLMELELIEPWLFLKLLPGMTRRFAEAIVRHLK